MFLYNENETMKLIGRQRYSDIGNKNMSGILDILDTYKHHIEYTTMQMALDMYSLGLIDGKRIERGKCRDN